MMMVLGDVVSDVKWMVGGDGDTQHTHIRLVLFSPSNTWICNFVPQYDLLKRLTC